jgi:hypothetical protein
VEELSCVPGVDDQSARVRCKNCASGQAAGDAPAPVLVSKRDSGRHRAAEPSREAPNCNISHAHSHHASSSNHRPVTKQASTKSSTPIVLGAAAVALFMIGILLLTSGSDQPVRANVRRIEPTSTSASARQTPAGEQPRLAATQNNSSPNREPVAVSITPAAPVTATTLVAQRTPTTAAAPAPVAADENPAESAYKELMRFDGLAENDTAGKVARVNAYLEKYGDSKFGSKATLVLSSLRAMLPVAAETPAGAAVPTQETGTAVKFETAKTSQVAEDDVPAAARTEPVKPGTTVAVAKLNSELAAVKLSDDSSPEAKAKAAWEHAENLFANQHYIDARQAYEGMQRTFAKTKTLNDNQLTIKDRLIAIDRSLNNVAPGLVGIYFSGTKCDAAREILRRIDAKVDFAWEMNAPAPAVPQENFSVRWTGVLTFPKSGRCTLFATHDDGFSLWIDNVRVERTSGDYFHSNYDINVIAGKHDIRIDFCQYSGPSCCQFQWELPGGTKVETIPAEQFSHDTRTETKPKR